MPGGGSQNSRVITSQDNKTALLTGGWRDGNRGRTTHLFSGGQLSAGPPLPAELTHHCAVRIGTKNILIGEIVRYKKITPYGYGWASNFPKHN